MSDEYDISASSTTRRYEGDDEPIYDSPEGRLKRKRAKWRDAQARSLWKVRIVGGLFVFTALFVIFSVVLFAVLGFVVMNEIPIPQNARGMEFRLGRGVFIFCQSFIFLPMAGFIAWGGTSLMKFHSRLIFITGIIMSVVVVLLLGLCVINAVDLLVRGDRIPVSKWYTVPPVILNGISVLLALLSTVAGLAMLMNKDVTIGFRPLERNY